MAILLNAYECEFRVMVERIMDAADLVDVDWHWLRISKGEHKKARHVVWIPRGGQPVKANGKPQRALFNGVSSDLLHMEALRVECHIAGHGDTAIAGVSDTERIRRQIVAAYHLVCNQFRPSSTVGGHHWTTQDEGRAAFALNNRELCVQLFEFHQPIAKAQQRTVVLGGAGACVTANHNCELLPAWDPPGVSIRPNMVRNTSLVFEPDVDVAGEPVAPTLVPSASLVLGPTVSLQAALAVEPAPVTSASTVFGPSVSSAPLVVAPDMVGSASDVLAPTVSKSAPAEADPGLVPSSSVVFWPSVALGTPLEVEPALVVSASGVFDPAVSMGSPLTAEPDAVTSAGVVFEPTVAISTEEQIALFLADQSAGWGSLTATEPANATDGDTGTAARGTSSGVYRWLEYTLGGPVSISRARMFTGGGSLTVNEWYVEYWDGAAWQQLFAPMTVVNPGDPGWHEPSFSPQQTVAIRVQVVCDSNDVQLDEFEIYGTPVDELAPVIALSPTFLYRPRRELVTLDGSGLAEAIADEMDEATASKDLIQATAGSRPQWLAAGSVPSRVPAIRGDGAAQHLQGATAHAVAVGNLHTCYVLVVRPAASNTESAAGIGSTSASMWHSIGMTSTTGMVRRAGLGNITAGSFSAGDPFWIESRRSASASDIAVTGGASASGAAGNSFSAGQVLVMCANRNSTGLIEASDAEVLAFIGFDSVLSAGDRATVQAALEAYAGI